MRNKMKILFFASLLIAISAAPSDNPDDRALCGTTSPFENIITTDAIHSTPAVVLIGKRNGDILRCLQEDPNVCEMFHQTGSPVYALLITGEYIYAGLGSEATGHGAILRCELNVKGSCSKTIHTFTYSVMSLEVVGGYIYAGLYGNTTIMRCAVDEVNSCRLLHKLDDKPHALIFSDDHIYAGIWNGQLMSCSLRTEHSCTPTNAMDSGSGLMGLTYIGNDLIVGTWDGHLWSCSQINNCTMTRTLNVKDLRKIATYNGVMYVLNEKGVYICDMAQDNVCSRYGHHSGTTSIAFSYSTYHMQSQYINEDTACTWQDKHRCPPMVIYYQPKQRYTLQVHVKDGKLRNSLGDLVDTSLSSSGAAIFAMGPDGALLLSNVYVPQLVVTSSLFAGSPVAGAGEMIVESGVIKKMTTCSDHYRPDLALNRQVVEALRSQGYTMAIESQACRDCCNGKERGHYSIHCP